MRESRKHEIGYKVAKLHQKRLGIRFDLEVADLKHGALQIGVPAQELIEFMEILENEIFREKYPS